MLEFQLPAYPESDQNYAFTVLRSIQVQVPFEPHQYSATARFLDQDGSRKLVIAYESRDSSVDIDSIRAEIERVLESYGEVIEVSSEIN